MNLDKFTITMIIKTLFEVKQNLGLLIYTFQLQLEGEERAGRHKIKLALNLT